MVLASTSAAYPSIAPTIEHSAPGMAKAIELSVSRVFRNNQSVQNLESAKHKKSSAPAQYNW